MNRFVYSAILAVVVASCSPSDTEQVESIVVFKNAFSSRGSEFQLGSRSRQWFIETIEGVPLMKYDPGTAREEPLGSFLIDERLFYLYQLGLQEVSDPERWIWTSTYTQRLYENLIYMENHPAVDPKGVKAVLDKMEHDSSFEFMPNKVQLTAPVHYPIQEFIEAINKAKTQEERDAIMEKWSAHPSVRTYPSASNPSKAEPQR